MSDWNSFTDRAYILPTDVSVYYDSVSGAGVNAPANVFGGTHEAGFNAGHKSKVLATGGGFAYSGISDQAFTGAYRARVDHTNSWLHLFYFGAGGSPVGSITSNGTATSYNTTSDYRLKKNARPIDNPVATLKKLRPITFEWTSNDKTTDGFLAHEFGKVIPDACHGKKDAVDKDGNIIPQGIDQSKAVPLLVAALQEAVARIEALEAQLAGPTTVNQ